MTGRQSMQGEEANEDAPLDAYLVTDLRLGYEAAGWTIHGVVSNLMDVRHATFGTFDLNQGAGGALERFLTPGQPRAIRLVVRRDIGGEPAVPERSRRP